jgi:hypothetical protein
MKIQKGAAEVYTLSLTSALNVVGVKATSRSLYPVPMVQEARWASGPVWTSAKTSPTSGLDLQTVYPTAKRCTDYAILANTIQVHFLKPHSKAAEQF